MWTWCFRAELYILFKIDPTRSGDVLIEVLGTEFNGVLGCDYFSAYRRYLREFAVIHRREGLSAEVFARDLEAARREVMRCGTEDVPPTKASGNLSQRLEKHGESYFRFLTTPGVEPTNNLAEQAIRFVVLDRLVTQGTRSEGGNRWCERIWTVIATCGQQGRSVFDYLETAVAAWFHRTEAPSLLASEC